MAAERNKGPILHILRQILYASSTPSPSSTHLPSHCSIFEVGSGPLATHARHFARGLENCLIQPSEACQRIVDCINTALVQQPSDKVLPAIKYEIGVDDLPSPFDFDIVYLANAIHFMPEQQGKRLFQDLGKSFRGDSVVIYGPFMVPSISNLATVIEKWRVSD